MLNEEHLDLLLLGAIAMTSVVVGLFFLRSWRKTTDVFFLLFALSFFVEGINRAVLGLIKDPNEADP
jgi:uncharacterized membrane protein HdeD (DUF308 family)